jgi:hypothetical protein
VGELVVLSTAWAIRCVGLIRVLAKHLDRPESHISTARVDGKWLSRVHPPNRVHSRALKVIPVPYAMFSLAEPTMAVCKPK